MKRYLVYYDDKPVNGIDGVCYQDAWHKMMLRTPKENKKHMRLRLANKGLLKALAEQGDY